MIFKQFWSSFRSQLHRVAHVWDTDRVGPGQTSYKKEGEKLHAKETATGFDSEFDWNVPDTSPRLNKHAKSGSGDTENETR
jgi:hypothetical protein